MSSQKEEAKMDLDEQAIVHPTITLKTLTDRKIVIEMVHGITTIGHVRSVLKEKEGQEVAHSSFILKGRVLEDSEPLAGLFKITGNSKEENDERVLHVFYYEPTALSVDPIEIAADWDAKNRLKVFKGAFLLSKRRFAEGAELLCDSLPTFSESTFFPFRDCVRYAVLAGTLVFDRPIMKKRILKSPEVLEVIADLAPCEQLVSSLYNCQYADFFKSLAELEEWLKQDWLLASHAAYLIRELRIKAYKQLLTAYRTLKLEVMASAFGVTAEFIDKELSRFIVAGRLACTINKVTGIVESVPMDLKHSQYRMLLKEGDALFNKVQRLGRTVSY